LIVDDEPLARKKIRCYLLGQPDVIAVAECSDGFDALEAIRRESPDILFLDLHMPAVDGFELLRRIGGERAPEGERVPEVVFVTAHDQYAVRAFEVAAVDYLVKPFDRSRFGLALDRARRHRAESATSSSDRSVGAAGRIDARRVVVRSRGRILPLPTEKIEWIESADNYVRVHTPDQTYLVRETLASLVARLDPRLFLPIHRRAIVNIDAVAEVRPGCPGGYEARLQSGRTLRVGRAHRHALRRFLGI
jgi:two-component system LytT family response regulator